MIEEILVWADDHSAAEWSPAVTALCTREWCGSMLFHQIVVEAFLLVLS